jgi:DNA-binding beta-propeller fold protein YncE
VFEVDPFWPKPLPNNWRIGMTIGVGVDAQDNVYIVHRPDTLGPQEKLAASTPPVSSCCVAAPPVLVFDPAGNLIASWGLQPGQRGAEGYDWPMSNHGITVDHKGNVWIGSNGNGDGHVLKFSQSGRFLMQIGKPKASQGSNDVANLNRPAKIFVDGKSNEAYIADGYGNKRVIVFDADTGAYKRHWGAYGNRPDDANLGPYSPSAPPARQFRNPVHCAELSDDGLLYVCDRANDRVQVFRPDGTFVREAFYAKDTLGSGSTWDIAFSKDPQQRYLYLVDGSNEKVYVLSRQTLEVLTQFGRGGRQPGQFFGVHSVATDSKGNLYTTETYEGKRLQRFVFKGVQPVPRDQGVPWPERR